VLYTDGITEARTPSGLLGAAGLAAAIADTPAGAPAAKIAARIGELLEADGIQVSDDAAALVIRAV
jgi:serine phosphatase RsbU (regulator of sigma subunit)